MFLKIHHFSAIRKNYHKPRLQFAAQRRQVESFKCNGNAFLVIDSLGEKEMTDSGCLRWAAGTAAADALFSADQQMDGRRSISEGERERGKERKIWWAQRLTEWLCRPADWQVTERASSISEPGKASRPMRNESAGVNLAPSCSRSFSNKVVLSCSPTQGSSIISDYVFQKE